MIWLVERKGGQNMDIYGIVQGETSYDLFDDV